MANKIISSCKRSKFGRYIKWLLHRIKTQSLGAKVVSHKFAGQTLKVYLSDKTSREWYDHDWEQLPELEFLLPHRLKKEDTIYDLGAHQGVVAMMIANSLENKCKVIAVEADARNEKIARKNYEINQFRNIISVHGAIAESDGFIEIELHDQARLAASTNSNRKVRIPSISIDSIVSQNGNASLILVDIEGAELMALKGAQKTLQMESDFMVEVHVNCGLEALGGSAKEVIDILKSFDYQLYYKYEEDNKFIKLDDVIPQKRFFIMAINPRKKDV